MAQVRATKQCLDLPEPSRCCIHLPCLSAEQQSMQEQGWVNGVQHTQVGTGQSFWGIFRTTQSLLGQEFPARESEFQILVPVECC